MVSARPETQAGVGGGEKGGQQECPGKAAPAGGEARQVSRWQDHSQAWAGPLSASAILTACPGVG